MLASEVSEGAHPPLNARVAGAQRPWLTAPTILAASTALIGHLFVADPFYTPLTRTICGVHCALVVLAVARYLIARPERLAWLEMLLVAHYLQFGLPVTVPPMPVGIAGIVPQAESHETAALIALVGAIAFIGAFGAFSSFLRDVRRPNPLLPKLSAAGVVGASRAYVLLASTYMLTITLAPSVRSAIMSVVNITDGLFGFGPLIAVPGLAYLTRPNRSTRIDLGIALGTVAVVTAQTSMLNNAVFPLAGLAVLWWYVRGRLPLMVIGMAVAVLVVLQPVKSYYRDIRWVEGQNVGTIDAWQQAFSDASAARNSGFGPADSGATAARVRLNGLTSMAYVLELVPAAVPHAGGKVYEVLAISVIPRVIWRDKPNMTKIGLDQFGIALGLTTEDNAERTTTGLTLINQGYYEHGALGSVGWMALLGTVLALLIAYFGRTLAGVLAGTAAMSPWIVSVDGGFINCFGSVWQAVAAATLMAWFVRSLGARAERTERESGSATISGTDLRTIEDTT